MCLINKMKASRSKCIIYIPFTCTYNYMYVCMYVCKYVRMHVCMYVCTYVCMYVCNMYAHVCTSGVRYTKFSYHDIGAICITIRYISRYAPVV